MAGPAEVQVRPGDEEDLDALTTLYNHYVTETPITFDLTPFTPDERRPWLLSYSKDGPHRLLVAEESASASDGRRAAASVSAPVPVPAPGRLLGYATSSPFRARPAYAGSVEVTVYLDPRAVGRGVGSLLYRRLLAELADGDVHRAFAAIALPNEASVRLHTRFGFRYVGTFGEAGRKFGRYWDVAWYEKSLPG
ncbi:MULTISPECIES: GNAT family N-acetyltransferase [unclassified Streptomyces]|uniref:GNAT family N-acetyltransferase n=1 Tax=unclassified Streptomyces TaxID=2593676 RepID=UPI0022B62E09|nr:MULTISPECIES: GNAT family N-acetyltransferase [unclassified Streptomyces]MCZ7414782.1 GNAT family N-acetyltransferase [Streptomyces sp. WMMC897]MCZ7431706.1 GNAT family N-acetyltransferase [Streptomyces sp. WMMC1477]